MLIRFIVLALYVAAYIALRTYLRDHPPRFAGKYVYEFERLEHALVRMWGLLLWPLPGFLWIGMMPIPALIIASLSIFIPLSIFLIFFKVAGVLESASKSIMGKVGAWLIPGLSIGITLLTFLVLLIYSFPPLQFLVFLAFVTFPPLLAVGLLMWAVRDLIPAPPEQPQRTQHILQVFTAFFTTFPKPSWIVEDGQVKTRIKGNTFFGVGPGWLMTEPENIAVLKGGTDIKRIAGPGVIFTEPTESPHQIIDLRNQIRITRIDAITRDGIEVNLPISSLFRVHPGDKKIALKSLAQQEPWPYRNKRDIYQIVFAEEVDPTGKTPLEAHQIRSWDEIPIKAAMNRVKQVIPEYSLEQLYSVVPGTAAVDPETGRADPTTGKLTRTAIGLAVRANVIAATEPLGFEILGGAIGNKVVPVNEDVVKQRVEAWKSRWISSVLDWEAEAQSKHLKDLAKIRSEARVKLLTQILHKTSSRLDDTDNASRYVAHHLLENLLHMARNSQVQEMLPERALLDLTQLHQLTKEE